MKAKSGIALHSIDPIRHNVGNIHGDVIGRSKSKYIVNEHPSVIGNDSFHYIVPVPICSGKFW
ncbi:hypothetical protein [Rubritalea marina]|uniref:hypothetical protein n=1 Tax=Rubritalea marina TaxID=361055 RepID=UPI0012EAD3CD|nr:hypothetical protein [Rubritalea marina]